MLALIAVPASARTDTAPISQFGSSELTIAWRDSTPVGLWWAGRLRRGVQLPAEGIDWFTWDPVLKRSPNREWRRWGTDRLVHTILDVLAGYRLANPFAPRVGIGDLSRRHGGDFGVRFGGLGHGSHQNGLDADVYYPRIDGLQRRQPRFGVRLRTGSQVNQSGPSAGSWTPRRSVPAHQTPVGVDWR